MKTVFYSYDYSGLSGDELKANEGLRQCFPGLTETNNIGKPYAILIDTSVYGLFPHT